MSNITQLCRSDVRSDPCLILKRRFFGLFVVVVLSRVEDVSSLGPVEVREKDVLRCGLFGRVRSLESE